MEALGVGEIRRLPAAVGDGRVGDHEPWGHTDDAFLLQASDDQFVRGRPERARGEPHPPDHPAAVREVAGASMQRDSVQSDLDGAAGRGVVIHRGQIQHIVVPQLRQVEGGRHDVVWRSSRRVDIVHSVTAVLMASVQAGRPSGEGASLQDDGRRRHDREHDHPTECHSEPPTAHATAPTGCSHRSLIPPAEPLRARCTP